MQRADGHRASKRRSSRKRLTKEPLSLNGIQATRFNSPGEVENVHGCPEQRHSCASRVNMSEHLAAPRASAFHAGATKISSCSRERPFFRT